MLSTILICFYYVCNHSNLKELLLLNLLARIIQKITSYKMNEQQGYQTAWKKGLDGWYITNEIKPSIAKHFHIITLA